MTTRFEWDENAYGVVWVCDTHQSIVAGPAAVPIAAAVVGSVAGAAISSAMAPKMKLPTPPAPPPLPAPAPMPTLDQNAVADAQKKQAQLASMQSGRLSTVLTSSGGGGSDKLG